MAITGAWLRVATGGAIALVSLQCSRADAQEAGASGAQGVPLGGFSVYPELRVSTSYEDNVFLSGTNPQGDTVVSVMPTVAVRSTWSVNKLDLDATSSLRRYHLNPQDNTNEYEGGANGEFDIDPQMPITGSVRAGHKAEVRGTPGDENTFDRYREYDFFQASAGIARAFNRLSVGLTGQMRNIRYAPINLGGVAIDQSALDRNTRNISLQIQYAYSSITAPYMSVSYSTVTYVHPGAAPPRNSHGISILFGTSFEFTRLLFGKVGVGYLQQTFDNAIYPDFSGPNFQADLTYKPTRLDTLHFNATRSIINSGIIGVPGVLQSEFTLSVVHQLTRRMSINVNLIYDREVYRGIDQQQDRYTGSISVQRTLNRLLALSLSYDRLEQRTNGISAGTGYDGDRFSLTLIASK